eukprot:TRINITY_DN1867_c1_g4_i1.p1 TRINITY_DN1867_c1_g4~~TRINITY_DN1867_c1_g4_i1.p1  ORF type:complete len:661 (+),score=255.76 TRINITY_DN1867_c1_g4_i1:63-2045(+)
MALPMDALERAMGFLSARDKAHAAMRVCRLWEDAARGSAWVLFDRDLNVAWMASEDAPEAACLWVQLHVQKLVLNSTASAQAVLAAYRRAAGLTGAPAGAAELFIRGVLEPADLATVAAMPYLERLHVGGFAPPAGVAFPTLRHLTCDGIRLDAEWGALPASLQGLSLSHVTDAGLRHLARFPALRALALANCEEVTRAGFLTVARSCGEQLDSLDLSGTAVDAYSLSKILKACRGLVKLNLRNCEGLNDAELLSVGEERMLAAEAPAPAPATDVRNVVNLFAELRQKTKKAAALVPVHLRDTPAAPADGAAPAAAVPAAAPADQPEDLHEELAGCHAAGLGSVLSQSPQLEEVVLSGVGWLDDAGLRRIFASLRQLRVLRVAKNRQLTDEAFTPPDVTLPPRLVTLSLANNVQLGDATLAKIAAELPGLETLHVSSCPLMTSAGVTHLMTRCRDLKGLYTFVVGPSVATSLGHRAGGGGIPVVRAANPMVTDAVLRQMWGALPGLQEFCGSFHPLSAAAFPAPGDAAPPHGWQLQKLEADYTVTSGEAYAAIIAAFPSLRKLCVQSARVPFTGEHAESLRRSMQNLEMLKLLLRADAVAPLLEYAATSRSLRHLDVEFYDPYGCGDGFDVVLWERLRAVCERRQIMIFFGRRARKYLEL